MPMEKEQVKSFLVGFYSELEVSRSKYLLRRVLVSFHQWDTSRKKKCQRRKCLLRPIGP